MCLGRPFFPIWKKKILTSLKGSREKKGGGGWKPALPQFFLSIVSSSLVRLLPPPPAHAALPGRGHQADITTQSLRGFFFLFFKQERAHPPAVFLNCFFLAILGLCRCVQSFSTCRSRGSSLVSAQGLLFAVASPVAECQL